MNFDFCVICLRIDEIYNLQYNFTFLFFKIVCWLEVFVHGIAFWRLLAFDSYPV